MLLSKQRIQQTRDFIHEALANTVIELFEAWENDPFQDIELFKGEVIDRWREQEDEILISLAADLAVLYHENARSKSGSKRGTKGTPQ